MGREMTLPLAYIRIYNALKEMDTATTKEIAAIAFTGYQHVGHVLRKMRDIGLCHVYEHKPRDNSGGTRIIVWKFGYGEDAKKEVIRDANKARRRRMRKLIEQHGKTIANKIIRSRAKGGPDRIVIDGQVIHQRGKPRGKRNA